MAEVRKYVGLSQAAFAKEIEENRGAPAISEWENEVYIPNITVIRNICERFQIDANWLLFGLGNKESLLFSAERPYQRGARHLLDLEDFTLVPKYKVRLSGGPGNYVLEEDIEHHLAFKTTWLKRRCSGNGCGLFTVTGDSMAPHITEGDIVLVDMSKNEPQDIVDGKIYAFGEWDTVKIKKLIRQGPKIMAHSENTIAMVPSMIEVDLEQFRLIGKIVWVGHEVK